MSLPWYRSFRFARADHHDDAVRELVGWGWRERPHGQTLASDVLGQFAEGDPSRPHFGRYGPYGGAKPYGFFFFAFNAGRYQVVGGFAASLEARKLAVPDYWNHRVLLFDLNADGSLANRRATMLIGQERGDMMEIGQGLDGKTREILVFDLSDNVTSGMEPRTRIGGPRSTVKTDLPRVGRTLALDEQRRRLWTGLIALDLSRGMRQEVPVLGWFGFGHHPNAESLEENHTGPLPNLLGYSVGFCHRFGGAVSATAVNPRTGTIYVADNARYRVLCFQLEFVFRREPLRARIGQATIGLTGTGGLAPLRFIAERSELPPGLELDADTGLITGTAIGPPGEYLVPVRVETAVGVAQCIVRIKCSRVTP